MTVALVTGAGGFVGGHLVAALERLPVTVRRVTRGAEAAGQGTAVDVLETDPGVLERALAGVDVVYFLAAVAHESVARSDTEVLHELNVAAPVRWLRAADRAGVGRFVWLSSIKVLGDVSVVPLAPDAPYRPGDAYARSKVLAEQRLLAEPRARTGLAIVRPPLVYGAGVRGNFLSLLRLADSPLPLPLTRATALRSLVGAGNLCDLLVRLKDRGRGIFHAGDPRDVCVHRLVADLRASLGRPAWQFPLPPALLAGAARLAGRRALYSRLFEPLRIDTAATRADLEWAPPMSQDQEIEATVAWFRAAR